METGQDPSQEERNLTVTAALVMWQEDMREMEQQEEEVDWTRVDAATTHLTRLNRALLQHTESCSCLEELVRQEESEQEELTAEVEHLRRSTHGRAIRGPQLSITEASLQSSLELISEHIMGVERENQRIEEELKALTKRLDDVRHAHLSQLDRVKAQYGERIIESGHLESQRKLNQLKQQKAILNSRVTSSRMEHQGRALEEWKEMKQEVVQLAGDFLQLRNKKNRNDHLNTAIQMLQMTIKTTREGTAAVSIQQQLSSSRKNFPSCFSFDTSPEHLTNKYSKSGHSYVQCHTPATSDGQMLDTQQLINPISEDGHRQNTLRYLTPEKTRQDIQQCLTRASSNSLQQSTLQGLIPYTAEWQRQGTNQHFTPVTEDEQRQETQQCVIPAAVDRQRQDAQQSVTHVTVDGQRLETQQHFTPISVDGQREEKQQCLTPVTLDEQRQETQQSLTQGTAEVQTKEKQKCLTLVRGDGQRQETKQCLTPVTADGQKQETQQHLTLIAGDRQMLEPLQCLSITGDEQRQEAQQHLSPATVGQQRIGTPRGKMFNSNLSLLKLQFPKYGERKRMSTSLTETFSGSGIIPVITKSSVCLPSDVSLKQHQSRTTSLTNSTTPTSGLLKGFNTDINCIQSVSLERRHSDGVADSSVQTPIFEVASTTESGSLAGRTADKLPVSSSCAPPAACHMQSSAASTQEKGLNQKELVGSGVLDSPVLPNKRARHTVISSLVPSPEIQFQRAPALLRLVYKIEANEQQSVTSQKDIRYQHPVTLCDRPSPEAPDIMAVTEADRGRASAIAVPEAPTTSDEISQASASILEIPTLVMETCRATTVSPLTHSQTTALTSAHPQPTTSPLAHHQPVTSHLAHHQPVTSHLAHHQPVTSLSVHPQPTTSPSVHPQPPTLALVHHQPTASPSPHDQPAAATSPKAYSCHTGPSQVVDNPLSSSQGFSLTEESDTEETNTTYSSETRAQWKALLKKTLSVFHSLVSRHLQGQREVASLTLTLEMIIVTAKILDALGFSLHSLAALTRQQVPPRMEQDSNYFKTIKRCSNGLRNSPTQRKSFLTGRCSTQAVFEVVRMYSNVVGLDQSRQQVPHRKKQDFYCFKRAKLCSHVIGLTVRIESLPSNFYLCVR
ncbi:uncharacterized protein [Panulirus ornatus]|uniref:uncharacterized protein isoform X2 n=1 Tax=Panulirus ornatus TaxID=150431 RepID=UPI003A8711BA